MRADITEWHDAETRQQPPAISDGFLRSILHVVEVKGVDRGRIKCVDLAEQATTSVEVAGIQGQADVNTAVQSTPW